jgi:hypothetical protein
VTGPPYPHPNPAPGSNAIGSFVIGVSPIGDIAAFDVWSTIISQYANSPILTKMILNFSAYVDETANLDAFFDNIWNINTAQGYGLDVWGRILGVSRILQVAVGTFFGFSGPSGSSGDSFNTQAFFSGQPLTSNFALSDSAFRTLLFAKALSNISDGSVKSINAILLALFPNRGNCYATDGHDMTMTYTFAFFLTSVELAIIGQTGVLPKPVGVTSQVVQPP